MNESYAGSARIRRVPALAPPLAVIAFLAVLDAADHWTPSSGLWLGPAAAAVLVFFARRTGSSWGHLGLGRDRVRSGVSWGLGAIGVVAVCYAIAVFIPSTRAAFLDARYHLGLAGALASAFVIIPVGTVLVEEIAFRGVLWAALARHLAGWRLLAVTSLLFGLWHVLPSLHMAAANRGVGQAVQGAGGSATALVVTGTVLVTTLGGVVAGELRRRSGSLLASVGMHWATNALGVLFGLLAWHLAG
jgi:membrane protease YdiL (CAAX protease family)